MVGIIARITRSAVVDVGHEDFIFTAVTKGLSRSQIIWRHLMPNAAIPISTIVGLELGALISGTIIVEVIFSWPGVGSLLYQAVTVRDTPLTTGVVIVLHGHVHRLERPDRPLLLRCRSPRSLGRRSQLMKLRSVTRANFLVGVACVGLIAVLATGGGYLTSHSPDEQSLLSSLQPPFDWDEGYFLGTDQLGRDILARMVSGARVSLLIAFSVVSISGLIGIFVGALSGYLGGRRDVFIQKADRDFLGVSADSTCHLHRRFVRADSPQSHHRRLTIQRWIPYARLARAQALSLRSRDFVAASNVMGGGTLWILRKHIIPNLIGSAVVIATFSMATAIIAEASLSFLGLGVPPTTPTWGGMLADARSYDTSAWWLAVFPGLGIFITVLGLNLLGDWLRDQLDPRDELNLV